MAAVERDIYIEQGATFRLAFTYVEDGPIDPGTGLPTEGDPHNLTGCTARLQVRKNASSDELLLEASTDPDDGITLGGVAGTVEIIISDEKSEALGAFSRDKLCRYDLKLYWPSGEEDRLIEGAATISPSVTKDAAP